MDRDIMEIGGWYWVGKNACICVHSPKNIVGCGFYVIELDSSDDVSKIVEVKENALVEKMDNEEIQQKTAESPILMNRISEIYRFFSFLLTPSLINIVFPKL